MIDRVEACVSTTLEAASGWDSLATRVLGGEPLSFDEALSVVRSPDSELLDLLAAAYRVRRQYFGNRVQLYFLMNAKSGLCPEDCGYCSQSKVSEAEIPRYNLLNAEKLLDGARVAAERQPRPTASSSRPAGRTNAKWRPSPRSCREIKAQVRPARSAPAWDCSRPSRPSG